jgi:hypothetical protein
MRMNNVYLVLSRKVTYSLCAKDPKRIPYGYMQNIFRRQKIGFRLPLVSRPKAKKYFVAALAQTPAQVDNVLFAAAKVDCRGDMHYPHCDTNYTLSKRKKGTLPAKRA